MTAAAGRRPGRANGLRYLSGARLDATTFAMMVDASDVRAAIAGLDPRLSLARAADVPSGKHPVVVDLFRVSEGRTEMMSVDQHRWASGAWAAAGACWGAGLGGAFGAAYGGLTGATMGGYVGLWLGPAAWLTGAAAGWMGGVAAGAMSGVAPGAVRGAQVGAGIGARASRRLSRTIGAYEEVLIGVPDVVVRGDRERRHFFVLRMYTDSALARWGDRAFAFGYRKQMAEIHHDLYRNIRVAENDEVLLDGDFVNECDADWQSAPQTRLSPRLLETLQQPLLAVAPDGRLARSRLERNFAASEVRAAAGTVRVRGGFAPGVPARRLRLPEGLDRHPWGALHARGIMSRVSYPSHGRTRP